MFFDSVDDVDGIFLRPTMLFYCQGCIHCAICVIMIRCKHRQHFQVRAQLAVLCALDGKASRCTAPTTLPTSIVISIRIVIMRPTQPKAADTANNLSFMPELVELHANVHLD